MASKSTTNNNLNVADSADASVGQSKFTSSYNPALDLNHGKKLTVDETAALLAYSYFNMNVGFLSTDREVRGSLSDKNINDLMFSIDVARRGDDGKVNTDQAAKSALLTMPKDMAARWRAVAALIPENMRYDNKGSGKRNSPLLTMDVRGVMQRALQEYKTANPADTEQIDKWESEINDVTSVLVGTATINLQEAGYPPNDPTVIAQQNRLAKRPSISFDLSQAITDLPDVEKNKAYRRANPVLPDAGANPIITGDGKMINGPTAKPGFAATQTNNMKLASIYQQALNYSNDPMSPLLADADPNDPSKGRIGDAYVMTQVPSNVVSGAMANSGPAFNERMQLSPNKMLAALHDRTPKEVIQIENNLRSAGYYELVKDAPVGGFNNPDGLGAFDPATIKAYGLMIADAVHSNMPIDKLIPFRAQVYQQTLASQGRKEMYDDQGRKNYVADSTTGALIALEYVHGQAVPKSVELSNPAAIIYTANTKAQSLLDRDLAPNEAQYIIDAVHRAETTHAAEVVTAQAQGLNTTAFDPNYIIEQYMQIMGGSGQNTGSPRLYGDALNKAVFGNAPSAPVTTTATTTAPPATAPAVAPAVTANSSSMMPAESAMLPPATMPKPVQSRSKVKAL